MIDESKRKRKFGRRRPMKLESKQCEKCNIQYLPTAPNQRFCVECGLKRARKSSKERRRKCNKKRSKSPEAKAISKNQCSIDGCKNPASGMFATNYFCKQHFCEKVGRTFKRKGRPNTGGICL